MYSIEDFRKAQRENADAKQRLSNRRLQQAKARSKAEDILHQLAMKLAPLQEEERKTSEVLANMTSRLLGPWDVGKNYDGGYILKHGSNDRCWGRRVWLRMVSRRGRAPEWQWEVQIHSIDGRGGKDIVFGPLVGSRKEDFEAHQRKTEKLLIEMGYILSTE